MRNIFDNPLVLIASLIGYLVPIYSGRIGLSVIFITIFVVLLIRLKHRVEAEMVLKKAMATVKQEDERLKEQQVQDEIRQRIIDLHLHAPDRVYYLGLLDQADTHHEATRIVAEAQIVATKHPLGMNI